MRSKSSWEMIEDYYKIKVNESIHVLAVIPEAAIRKDTNAQCHIFHFVLNMSILQPLREWKHQVHWNLTFYVQKQLKVKTLPMTPFSMRGKSAFNVSVGVESEYRHIVLLRPVYPPTTHSATITKRIVSRVPNCSSKGIKKAFLEFQSHLRPFCYRSIPQSTFLVHRENCSQGMMLSVKRAPCQWVSISIGCCN